MISSKLVFLCKFIKESDNNEDTNLLRYGINTAIRSFMVKTPVDHGVAYFGKLRL